MNNIFNVGIRGGSAAYNSYLIENDGVCKAIVGCVPESAADEYIDNIKSITKRNKPDYLILPNTQTCYAGTVARIIETYPEIKIAATTAGLRNLKEITNLKFNEYLVKDGGTLDLGGAELKFMIVPNLPWQDSMFAYFASQKTLFTGNAFSSEGCDYARGAGEYYEKFLSPFADYVRNALNRIKDLEVDIIYPSRRVVPDVKSALESYAKWSKEKAEGIKTAAVVYASTDGCTRRLAEVIAEALTNRGIKTEVFDVSVETERAIEAVKSADALAFGSPTVNKNALKPVWDVIASINPVLKKGTPCLVFGAYGWSGEALNLLQTHLSAIKMRMPIKPIGCCFRPSDEEIKNAKERAAEFAAEVLC